MNEGGEAVNDTEDGLENLENEEEKDETSIPYVRSSVYC